MKEKDISDFWIALSDYSVRQGHAPVKDVVEMSIDEHWRVWLNGTREEKTVKDGVAVPAYGTYIEYCGWPWGIINIKGGTMGDGAKANVDNLIKAIRSA